MLRRYRLIDLFAGCGGMTRGFVDTDRFEPVLAVESDEQAAATYDANFGSHAFAGPIEQVAWLPPADVIIGGPPCQGFSMLNRGGVGLDRRGLWVEYARCLADVTPRAFVMENVPELLRSPEFCELSVAARSLGYAVEGRILNAADYGVPQRRRRAIVIGSQSGEVPWPEPTHRARGGPDGELPAWRTFADAVVGLALEPDGRNWHRARRPRPESIERYEAVPRDGGNRFEMQAELDRRGRGELVPRCWRDKPTGTTDVFGRLWWDRPAFTIRTEFYKPEKGRYLHPSEHRPITVREAARCMSFPDDFVLPEGQSMTSIARQVGNAVPPLLAERIGRAVADHLDACVDREPAAPSVQSRLPMVAS